MANINEIRSPYWSLSLTTAYDSVQGADAIKQSISVILGTQKGSAPLMPDFGINLQVGQTVLNGADIIKDIRQQIAKYETRVKVTKITQAPTADGQLTISIYWTYQNLTGTNTITI